jgi:hypothetical protein
MFKKLLHSRPACFAFTAFLVGFLCLISNLLPDEMVARNNGWLMLWGVVCILLIIASIIGLIGHTISLFAGVKIDMINLAKPHRAVLSKRKDGDFEIQITQFPLHCATCEHYSETGALENYESKKKEDAKAQNLKDQSGPVRVITEASGAKIQSAKDAFEHIEGLLKQYAPEKAEAIRKLKEVFDKKD